MAQQLTHERNKLLRTIEKLLEGPMILLGFVWLLLLLVEFIWGLSAILTYLSLTIWIIFIIDFVIKFILAPKKLPFLKRNWLTAISLIIPALRVFSFLRFIRLLKALKGIRLVRMIASLNRSMRSLAATMSRRGFGYVMLLSVIILFGGAAGMYGMERGNPGFQTYGLALWWTAMRIITAGSDFWPTTSEGRVFAFILALYGYAIFGYVTATLASFFLGKDTEDQNARLTKMKNDVADLKKTLDEINARLMKKQE